MTTRFSALAFLLISAAGVHASPIFEFTWTSVPLPDVGDYSGQGVTITGEIFGLPDNGSGPASDIVLDSIIGATPDPSSPFANLPLDLIGPDFGPTFLSTQLNQFIVQNDEITSAEFLAETVGPSELFGLGAGTPFLEFLSDGAQNSSPPDVLYAPLDPYSPFGYYGTATFSLVTPEPSSLLLTFFAFAAGTIYRLIRRIVCNSASRNPY